MDDLISRQAVLDAINSGMLTDDDTQFECPSECNSMLEWAVNAVKELPTAEPEIIKCRECLMHGVCRFEQGLGLDGYCSQAERKSDG